MHNTLLALSLKTAIMLPFDWIAAFGSMCLFSGGFGALNPPGKVLFPSLSLSLPCFTPSGVYGFLRQKHQAVRSKAGAAAWCQEEGFFFLPLCLRFFACFSSGVDDTVVQRKWGQQDPGGICETLKTPTGPSIFFFFCYHDRIADADDVDEDATVTTREQQRVYCNITLWHDEFWF